MTVDPAEIQGLVAGGYQSQRAATFLLLDVADPEQARASVRAAKPWTADRKSHDEPRYNLAFTCDGLAALGRPDPDLVGFSREFREGMARPHRQRILGDLGPSDPDRWTWGKRPVHALACVYAPDPVKLAVFRSSVPLAGFTVVRELPTVALRDQREHFGFRDGLSKPMIRGLNRSAPGRTELAAGEFVLGEADESGAVELAPGWAAGGSFLVVRQLAQDVVGFWGWLRGAVGDAEAVRWAAKMVGRWPDGTPLARSPQAGTENRDNTFTYRDLDPTGVCCPFGAHIRRANPRDDLTESAKHGLAVSLRHQMLRRGRMYGMPVPPGAYPPGVEVVAEDGWDGSRDEQGLIFACVVASLGRQFEFVQQSWLGNPKFHGLSEDADPVSGTSFWSKPGGTPVFTAQAEPFRERIALPRPFVRTVGGGYFFLPSRAGLRRIGGAA